MTYPHGTNARYQKHIKHGEKPCAACTRANNEYVWTWRIRSGRTPSVAIPVEVLRDYANSRDITELLCAVFPPAVVDAILEPTQVVPS